jgi:hypothetical protein
VLCDVVKGPLKKILRPDIVHRPIIDVDMFANDRERRDLAIFYLFLAIQECDYRRVHREAVAGLGALRAFLAAVADAAVI